MQKFLNRMYYWMKPSVPRSWLLSARRLRIKKDLKEVADRWPIDERAAVRPEGMAGVAGPKAICGDPDPRR